jgi:hypothetical protein
MCWGVGCYFRYWIWGKHDVALKSGLNRQQGSEPRLFINYSALLTGAVTNSEASNYYYYKFTLSDHYSH